MSTTNHPAAGVDEALSLKTQADRDPNAVIGMYVFLTYMLMHAYCLEAYVLPVCVPSNDYGSPYNLLSTVIILSARPYVHSLFLFSTLCAPSLALRTHPPSV